MKSASIYIGMGGIFLLAPFSAAAQDSAAGTEAAAVAEAEQGNSDIIVTARKRSESLLEVPIAVTAFNADSLARQQVGNLMDIGPAVPSMVISVNQGSPNGATVFLRGIGQDNSNAVNDSGVGTYLDGVYLGRSIGSLLDINNFERIEVLRGPQGSLYGRNTPGGAIKLVSKRPTFDAFHFNGDVTVGSFNRLDFRGSVNVPVSSSFAVTVSALNLTNDGHYRHALTGVQLSRKNSSAVRATALWQATDNLSIFVTGDYAKDRSGIQAATPFDITDPNNYVPLYGSLYRAAPDLQDNNRYDGGGGSVTAELDLPGGTFSSITAYRHLNFNMSYDFGSSPIGNDLFTDLETSQFSQELQYVSSLDGPINFVGGLYYFREYSDSVPHFLVTLDATTPTTTGDIAKLDLPYISLQTTNSYSAYGELYITPFEPLNITLGGRYTHDNKHIERGGAAGTGSGSVSFNDFSPKVTIDYSFAGRHHVYATWSNGYKAGAFQPYSNQLTAFTAVPPEKVMAWELGLKSELVDRILTVNLAAYQNDYDDLQLNVSSSEGNVVINSADLRVRGIEAELYLTPFTGFTLTGSFSVSDSSFQRVPAAAGSPLITDRQKNLPSYQLRLSPHYVAELANADRLEVGLVFSATGEDQKILPNDPFHLQKAFETVDARIAYSRPEQGWSIELAGKNLTDTTYFTTSTLLGTTRSSVRWYAPGATWSLRFGLNF